MFVRKSVLPRSISVFLATIGLLVAALIFACAPALAEEVTGFESSPFTFGEFNAPRGVAVDNGSGASSGNVYVADAENQRVVKFSADGNTQLGEFKLPEEGGHRALGVVFWDAVDPNTGSVYASSKVSPYLDVTKFSSTGTFEGQITESSFPAEKGGQPVVSAGFTPGGVAVSASGTLYVADIPNKMIDSFSSTGTYEAQFPDETELADSIAIDSKSGNIFVTDQESAVREFSPTGEPLTTPPCANNKVSTNLPIAVASDPIDGALVVGEGGFASTFHLMRYPTLCGEPIAFGEGTLGEAGSVGIAVSGITPHKHDVYAVSDSGTTANIFTATVTAGAEEVTGFESSPFTFGEFNAPRGVAVDNGSGASSGNVYVADAENQRVVKFSADGNTQLGEFKLPEEGGHRALGVVFWDAVDPNTGSVYASSKVSPYLDVTKFSSTGTFEGQITESSFPAEKGGQPVVSAGFTPGGVAVSASGTLYVADIPNKMIDSFSSTGTYEAQFPDETELADSIAIDSKSGNIFVTDQESAVREFSPTGEPLTTPPCANNKVSTNLPIAVASDPIDGALVVGEGGFASTFHLMRYPTLCGEPIAFGEGTLGEAGSVGIAVSGITPHKHDVYAVSDSGTTANIFKAIITTGSPLFKVENGPAENVTPTSATLNGTVKPEGEEVTGIEFEYGIGNVSEKVVAIPATATGSGEVSVHVNLTELTPNKTYLYRVVGSTTKGSKSAKPTFTVKTPVRATVTTEAASGVASEGATLNGKIVPTESGPAEYYFEYGKVISEKTSAHKALVSETVAEPLSGLEPATRYHARLVAIVEGHVVNGVSPEKEEGPEIEFTTAFRKPTAIVSSAQSVTRTGALLGGEINPENNETTYHFEYEYTKEGTVYKEQSQSTKISPGSAPVAVGPEALSELKPGTTYHYRLVATNEGGTSTSPDGEFTTAKPELPIVNSGTFSSVTQTTATIGGEINPNGLQTSYILEVGADTTYGTPSFGEVGSGTELVPLGFTLTNLLPATTYHYRLVGVNEDGTVLGADVAFTTPGFPNPIAEPTHPVIIPTPPESKCKTGFVEKNGKCVKPTPAKCRKGFVKKHGKCVKKPKPRKKPKKGKKK